MADGAVHHILLRHGDASHTHHTHWSWRMTTGSVTGMLTATQTHTHTQLAGMVGSVRRDPGKRKIVSFSCKFKYDLNLLSFLKIDGGSF